MTGEETRAALLAAELLRDWTAVRTQRDRAVQTDARASPQHAAYVALALDHAYWAMETLLLRVERGLDLPVRRGDGWRRGLLEDASLVLPGVRPAIIPGNARAAWAELLRFRHFLRHGYAVDLDPARLAELSTLLDRAVETTQPAVDALARSLETPQAT